MTTLNNWIYYKYEGMLHEHRFKKCFGKVIVILSVLEWEWSMFRDVRNNFVHIIKFIWTIKYICKIKKRCIIVILIKTLF